MQQLEPSPEKLRANRISQLTLAALEILNRPATLRQPGGLPVSLSSFIATITKESRSRFKTTEATARDYSEIAARSALQKYALEFPEKKHIVEALLRW